MPHKIAFHLDDFNERGVVRSTFHYAQLCASRLNHEIVVIAPKNRATSFSKTPDIMKAQVMADFPVLFYEHLGQIDPLLQKQGVDFLYVQKAGSKQGVYTREIPLGVHCVFLEGEPHGTHFAAISQWLAQTLSARFGQKIPFVSLPILGPQTPTKNLRRRLRIPPKATVFGRYGGLPSFDLLFVHSTIEKILHRRKDIYFLFMNTLPFLKHPRIIYLPPTVDIQQKVNFIHACDAMLHARKRGESFGLSIAEFLYQGKPVYAWRGGIDQNHTHMLKETGMLYHDAAELYTMLLNFNVAEHPPEYYQNATKNYSSDVVIHQFQDVFLSAL